jgi:hypothetical protein
VVAEIFHFFDNSLASAEIEILLGMGNQPRFGGSGKIGWARLTDTDFINIFRYTDFY